jgi:hypothetical protein
VPTVPGICKYQYERSHHYSHNTHGGDGLR